MQNQQKSVSTYGQRVAGLLTEIGPELQKRASLSTATLDDVQAAFARVGGKPLSEVVIEQRGPADNDLLNAAQS